MNEELKVLVGAAVVPLVPEGYDVVLDAGMIVSFGADGKVVAITGGAVVAIPLLTNGEDVAFTDTFAAFTMYCNEHVVSHTSSNLQATLSWTFA